MTALPKARRTINCTERLSKVVKIAEPGSWNVAQIYVIYLVTRLATCRENGMSGTHLEDNREGRDAYPTEYVNFTG
jgi:hypothetical protein